MSGGTKPPVVFQELNKFFGPMNQMTVSQVLISPLKTLQIFNQQ